MTSRFFHRMKLATPTVTMPSRMMPPTKYNRLFVTGRKSGLADSDVETNNERNVPIKVTRIPASPDAKADFDRCKNHSVRFFTADFVVCFSFRMDSLVNPKSASILRAFE